MKKGKTISKIMKKGDIEPVVIIILTLICLFALLGVLSYLKTGIQETEPYVGCKTSVYLHTTQKKLTPYDFSSGIECKTGDVTVSTPLAYPAGQRQAKAMIAEKMYKCYDQYGAGKWELFKGDGVFCAVCDYIEFKDKTNPIVGLNEYLMTTPIPLKTVTFAEYFTGAGGSREAFEEIPAELIEKDKIKTDGLHSVVFVYIKGRDELKNFDEKVKSAAVKAPIAGAVGYGLVRLSAGTVVRAVAWIGVSLIPGSLVARGTWLLGKVAWTVTTTFFGLEILHEYEKKGEPYDWYASVHFVPFDKEQLNNLGCKQFQVERK